MPGSVEEFRPQGAPEQALYSGAERRVWERCRVTAHFAPGTNVEAALASAAAWTGRSEPLCYQACRGCQPSLVMQSRRQTLCSAWLSTCIGRSLACCMISYNLRSSCENLLCSVSV